MNVTVPAGSEKHGTHLQCLTIMRFFTGEWEQGWERLKGGGEGESGRGVEGGGEKLV